MLSSTNRSKAARSGAALALLLLALLLRVPQATCTADHYNPAMPFDLRAAWIVVLNDLSGAEQKAIDMLVDEIAALEYGPDAAALDVIEIKPKRGGVDVRLVALAWKGID